MGKGDTPKPPKNNDNEPLPWEEDDNHEQGSAEPLPPTSHEEVIEEGVFPGDVFRLSGGEKVKIDYRIISSSEVEGDPVYEVEIHTVDSSGKTRVEKRTLEANEVVDYVSNPGWKIVRSGDDRYEARYGAETREDALEAALQYRAGLEDGSEAARLVDKDIDKMYSRKIEDDLATAERHLSEMNANKPKSEEKTGDTGPIPSESGESPRDELARLSVEYGEMEDRNSNAAWTNKNRRKALKEWIDQDNAKSSREDATESTSTPATGETGPIPSESGESPRDEIARLRSEYGGMQYKDTDKAKAVLKRIDELHAWIENDNKQSRGEKSTDNKAEKSLDKLLEDFKSSENISDEEMKKFRKLIDVMVQAGMVNAPEKKEGEQKQETPEEKAKRERDEKLEAITKEIEEKYNEQQKADLSKYGKAKADYDLAGHWGAKRRKEALGKVENELYDNRVAQIRALIEAKKKAGLYEGTPEQEELEFMMELSKLDGELQKANIDEINKRFGSEEEYKKNFNWFQRLSVGAAKKFFNKGGKIARAFKNTVGGMATGGAVGAVIGFAGVGFPVTLAAAGGIAAARFSMTTGARLDTLRGAYADMKPEEKKELDSKQAAQLLEQMKKKYGDKHRDALHGYVREGFEKQRQRGDTERKKAIGRASWNAAWFSAGAAIGTFGGRELGGMVHDMINAPRGSVGTVAGGGDGAEAKFVSYNTNGAPEHLFQKLTGTSGARSEQLFHALAKEVGGYDNLFVDSSGSPVDLKDYGGSIDIGFTGWDQDGSARLSDPLRAALERRGINVGVGPQGGA